MDGLLQRVSDILYKCKDGVDDYVIGKAWKDVKNQLLFYRGGQPYLKPILMLKPEEVIGFNRVALNPIIYLYQL